MNHIIRLTFITFCSHKSQMCKRILSHIRILKNTQPAYGQEQSIYSDAHCPNSYICQNNNTRTDLPPVGPQNQATPEDSKSGRRAASPLLARILQKRSHPQSTPTMGTSSYWPEIYIDAPARSLSQLSANTFSGRKRDPFSSLPPDQVCSPRLAKVGNIS